MYNIMRNYIKMCDLPVQVAATVFCSVNEGRVSLIQRENNKEPFVTLPQLYLVANSDPNFLIYPEGWYFYRGCFTNRLYTSRDIEELEIYTPMGVRWDDFLRTTS